jgi:hypothetical protein
MPPRTAINDYREITLDARIQGLTASKMLEFFNDTSVRDGGRALSEITLKRALASWTPPRPTARQTLNAFEDLIYDQYFSNIPINRILCNINLRLKDAGDPLISERTLFRQLKLWGLDTRHHALEISDALIDRVKYLFFTFGLTDIFILRDLHRAGFQARLWIIKKIR